MQQTVQGKKYQWRLPKDNYHQALSLAAQYNVSIPLMQTLVSRGYATKEQLDSFLFSSFEKDVGDAGNLKDAHKAVERIIAALDAGEKILIAGDYDVDGITSSAVMLLCLLPLGAKVNFFLPHRVKDGYGLSTKVVERAAASGYRVIITVDNGITAFEPAKLAKEKGIDLIITDHHRPHDHVPDAFAIINPQQKDCAYPFKFFAGVGVIFKVMSLLYAQLGKEIPPKVYELLLLGTVADVVPLIGENRFWVRHGLQYINKIESLALKILKQNGKVTEKPRLTSLDIGFSIAPQINALGRLEDSRQGVKFLIGSDEAEVQQVGTVLLELNQARKEIERSIFNEVNERIQAGAINLEKENLILAASEQWPPGVIGLVASRLVSAYGKPTILLHMTSSGLAKGSCRSIEGFNMFDALAACNDLLTSFGGHSMAAGLALPKEHLSAFKQRLEQRIAEELTPEDLLQKISLDAMLKLPDVTKKFITDIELLEPFGNANPQPAFYLQKVTQVQKPLLLKEAHVKCSVFADGIIKPVIFFNRPDIFEFLLEHEQEQLDMAVQVTENHWNGRTNLELLGIDVALSE